MNKPQVIDHEGIRVVRDDLIEGGTKARVVGLFFNGFEECVYASPVYGHAQIALALVGRQLGKKVTIFCAKRKTRHECTARAEAYGAVIMEVEHGYLNVVQCRAREYSHGSREKNLVPFGMACEMIIDALAGVAISTGIVNPPQVWCAAGSGVLTRALQRAWPHAKHYAVQVGGKPTIGLAILMAAHEKYEQSAKVKPPFPSCINYDAKVWIFMKAFANPGAIFWNVAG